MTSTDNVVLTITTMLDKPYW